MPLVLLVFSILILPTTTYAAVVINEVAWMGTSVNANDEWIELYNSGSESVSLDGWVLEDGVSLTISLAGAVGAGEYALLERTDDTTVPSVPAYLVYTGALANDGRTLTLKRSGGSVEDTVVGGTDWTNIGGDNTTKDTAQRALSGWKTAPPTPGASNTTSPVSHDEEKSQNTTTPLVHDSDRGAGMSVSLTESTSELTLTIDCPTIVYVNQPIAFTGVPEGIGKTLTASLSYEWNFGDGYAGERRKVSHTFAYPGEYVVVLRATYARHDSVARKTIHVLPVDLTLGRTDGGDILLTNTTPDEIDIGGFTLRGVKNLTLPPHTIILPHGSLTIAQERIGVSSPHQTVTLLDLGGGVVAQYPSFIISTTKETPSYVSSVSSDKAPNTTIVDDGVLVAPTTTMVDTGTTIPLYAAAAQSVEGEKESGKTLPYIGLIAIMSIGILTLYIRRPTDVS